MLFVVCCLFVVCGFDCWSLYIVCFVLLFVFVLCLLCDVCYLWFVARCLWSVVCWCSSLVVFVCLLGLMLVV